MTPNTNRASLHHGWDDPVTCTLPSSQQLEQSLMTALPSDDDSCTGLAIERRQPNVHSSTFVSEIVTCRLSDDRTVELLCKYGQDGRDGHDGAAANRHQRGVPYEGWVYQYCLASTPCSTPRFYGLFHHPDRAQCWLVLEYLRDALSVSKMIHDCPLTRAAEWIGQFHALQQSKLDQRCYTFLHRYGDRYYRHWASQAVSLAEPLCDEVPWFNDLCHAFADRAGTWLAENETVIHGEYYPGNILVQNGTVYPVDWESAAKGAGEVDLAALTEYWPAAEVRACRQAYIETRWSGSPPLDFQRRFDAARLYLHLRWLGERKQWTLRPKTARRFDEVRVLGERLDLI